MKPKALQKLILAILLTGVFATTDALAGDRQILQDDEGFCASLPLFEKQIVTQHIRESRAKLRQRQAELSTKVKNQNFSGLDIIITIALPGGLLYAALKHNYQLDERKQLELVTLEINQLSGDLLTFQSAASRLKVAAVN